LAALLLWSLAAAPAPAAAVSVKPPAAALAAATEEEEKEEASVAASAVSGERWERPSLLSAPVLRLIHDGEPGEPYPSFENTNLVWFLSLILIVLFSLFGVFSVHDLYRFVNLLRGTDPLCQKGAEEYALEGMENARALDAVKWSMFSLIGLTAYRFYTGFLTATWLPYLLAMEGDDLWSNNQAFFMGVAKLIYGVTVLLNPVFGLVGDKAVKLSHGVGRRVYVRLGVITAALGICICLLAANVHAFYPFLFGILVWRLGEALNDVTTEALVPEMVPQEQFQTASAVKAASFLLGGLFGYVMLMILVHVHYSWLYYAYLFGMFVSAIPALSLLASDLPLAHTQMRQREDSFVSAMIQAYLKPMRTQGGFPRACLAVFVFSLGTAPMFFLLLIVRDVVGIQRPVALQEHFSGSSILFFVSAAFASVLLGGTTMPRTQLVAKVWRLNIAVGLFGAVCFLIPCIAFLPSVGFRSFVFYLFACVYGCAFGVAFSSFQDVTWQLLPHRCDVANAMGFNVMCRLLGIGVGNFAAGLILDQYYDSTYAMGQATKMQEMIAQRGDSRWDPRLVGVNTHYRFMGYLVMCGVSGLLVWTAAGLAHCALALVDDAAASAACSSSSTPGAVAAPPSPQSAAAQWGPPATGAVRGRQPEPAG